MSSHPHHISPLQRVVNPKPNPKAAGLLFRAFLWGESDLSELSASKAWNFFPRRFSFSFAHDDWNHHRNHFWPNGTILHLHLDLGPWNMGVFPSKKLPSLGIFLVVWGGDETFDQNHVIFKLSNPELNTFKLCHDCILGEGENVPNLKVILEGVFFSFPQKSFASKTSYPPAN